MRCVSQAVRPVKITTPRIEMTIAIADDPMKMLIRLATMMPMRPMIRKLPIFVRSRCVV